FLDADVIVAPDVVATVSKIFDADRDVAALVGSYDDAPGEPDFLSQYRNILHHYVHQVSNETFSSFWGACGAVRRQLFLEAGGFDESYGQPSIEDIEFGYRITEAGHQIRLVKSMQVKHLKRWAVWQMIKTDVFSRA